jgi:hypothetical protein
MGPGRDPVGKKIVIVEIKNGQLVLRDTILPEGTADAAAPATGTDTAATATTTSGTAQ